MSAGGAEREARELADAIFTRWVHSVSPQHAKKQAEELREMIETLAARCANEARLEALEHLARQAREYYKTLLNNANMTEAAWLIHGAPIVTEAGTSTSSEKS